MRCISVMRSLYFTVFSASFFITFMLYQLADVFLFHYPGLWCLTTLLNKKRHLNCVHSNQQRQYYIYIWNSNLLGVCKHNK
jgi:hypothetical protein